MRWVRSVRGVRPSAARALAGALVVVLAACAPAVSPTPASVAPDRSSPQTSGSPADSAAPGASASTAANAEPSVRPAAWSDCGDGLQCATLVVPLDHETPGSGVLNVSLVRMPATDRDARLGSLVVNPGGPGGSGVEFVRESGSLFKDLRRRFDIVGFDPRGVNLSSGIRCIDNLDPRAELDPSPDDPEEREALIEDARAFAEACAERNGNVLPHLGTDDVVRDLDHIRAALGEEALSYLGFSYGTLIGARYADRYPDRVRAMVLDGAVDPAESLETLRDAQARGFERALDQFLEHCRRIECEFAAGDDPSRAFESIMADIESEPLRTRGRRKVGPGLAWSAVLGAMYSRAGWNALDAALTFARAGDGTGFVLVADPFRGRKRNGSYSNMIDAYTANTCADYPTSRDPEDYIARADRVDDDAPHFGQMTAYNDLVCAFWAADPGAEPRPVEAAGAPPIVVVGTTGDPATPFANAEALADQLESGVLVRHEGEGHTGFAQSECVAEIVREYLISIRPPADGKVCR
jgi:pimeloyl-ACP methyl ester carboxylesterase